MYDKGAAINAQDNDSWTALMKAVLNGHQEMVKFLIKQGAKIEETSYSGKTALIVANKKGHQ